MPVKFLLTNTRELVIFTAMCPSELEGQENCVTLNNEIES